MIKIGGYMSYWNIVYIDHSKSDNIPSMSNGIVEFTDSEVPTVDFLKRLEDSKKEIVLMRKIKKDIQIPSLLY